MLKTLDRRRFVAACSSLGLTGVFADSLWGAVQAPTQPKPMPPGTPPAGTEAGRGESGAASARQEAAAAAAPANAITKDMVKAAAAVAGLTFTDPQLEMALRTLNDRLGAYKAIWELHIPNDVAPALDFNPVLPGMTFEREKRRARLARMAAPDTPKNIEDVAFYSVRQLGELLRTKKITASALTEMYLERLKRYDPVLHFVITLTDDRARAQAKDADREIAAGKYRGPLHGIPWGAKDLLAVKGYRTTWGAGGFETQT